MSVVTRTDRPTDSVGLAAFLNRHGRLPRLGDVPAPWHHRGWLLPYVIQLHGPLGSGGRQRLGPAVSQAPGALANPK
jgi:hypothetical protein